MDKEPGGLESIGHKEEDTLRQLRRFTHNKKDWWSPGRITMKRSTSGYIILKDKETLSYKGRIRLIGDFLLETMEARSQWDDTFKLLREKEKNIIKKEFYIQKNYKIKIKLEQFYGNKRRGNLWLANLS